MTCPKCGNQLNDGAVFCPKCGYRVEISANNVPNQPIVNNAVANTVVTGNAQKKTKTWKVVLITIAATIVAGFVGLMALGSKSTDTSTQNAMTSAVSETQPTENPNTTATSDAEALNELLGYIDQAEEVVQKYNSDYEALNEEENLETGVLYRNRADIMQAAYSELEVIRDNMVQI